jgi:hypothetical protein
MDGKEYLARAIDSARRVVKSTGAREPYTLLVHPAHVENEHARALLQEQAKRGLPVLVQESIDSAPVALAGWLAGKR